MSICVNASYLSLPFQTFGSRPSRRAGSPSRATRRFLTGRSSRRRCRSGRRTCPSCRPRQPWVLARRPVRQRPVRHARHLAPQVHRKVERRLAVRRQRPAVGVGPARAARPHLQDALAHERRAVRRLRLQARRVGLAALARAPAPAVRALFHVRVRERAAPAGALPVVLAAAAPLALRHRHVEALGRPRGALAVGQLDQRLRLGRGEWQLESLALRADEVIEDRGASRVSTGPSAPPSAAPVQLPIVSSASAQATSRSRSRAWVTVWVSILLGWVVMGRCFCGSIAVGIHAEVGLTTVTCKGCAARRYAASSWSARGGRRSRRASSPRRARGRSTS